MHNEEDGLKTIMIKVYASIEQQNKAQNRNDEISKKWKQHLWEKVEEEKEEEINVIQKEAIN